MRFFQIKIMLKSTNSDSASRRKRHWSSTVVLEFEKLLMEDKGFYIFSPLQKRACTWPPMFKAKANTTGKFNLPGLVPCHLVRRNSAAELSLVYLLTATNIGQMAVRFICGGDIAITNIMATHAEFSPVYLLTATYRRAV